MNEYERDLADLWAAIKAPRTEDALKTISLFAGGGGSSMGYKSIGCDVRLAVEWGSYPASAYRLNFPETQVFEGDIEKLSVDEAMELARVQPGELDILDGSPPCQGFSTAGARSLTDPRNSLFREYVRLLRGLRPRALVMENVSGLVKGKMRWVFVRILRELKEAGYRVSCRLMNAKWYGVPQVRARVIFIGYRDDLGIDPTHPHPMMRPRTIAEACPWLQQIGGTRAPDAAYKTGWDTVSSTDRPSPTVCKTSDAITFSSGWKENHSYGFDGAAPMLMKCGLAGSSQTQAMITRASDMHERAGYIPAPPLNGRVLAYAERMKPDDRLSDVDPKYKTMFMAKANPEKPSRTIIRTATYMGGPATFAPTQSARGLSIGEVMRLCSFPDEYAFPEAKTERRRWEDAWGVCGNSVPPMFMRAIAAHVQAALTPR